MAALDIKSFFFLNKCNKYNNLPLTKIQGHEKRVRVHKIFSSARRKTSSHHKKSRLKKLCKQNTMLYALYGALKIYILPQTEYKTQHYKNSNHQRTFNCYLKVNIIYTSVKETLENKCLLHKIKISPITYGLFSPFQSFKAIWRHVHFFTYILTQYRHRWSELYGTVFTSFKF